MGSQRKLKIWCLFGNKPALSVAHGDSIGEARIVRMLSHDFDVYYNGVPLDAKTPLEFGGGSEINLPVDDAYDLYYVRANPEVFLELPHPKVYMAYPYHDEAFRVADALVVTTEVWGELLRSDRSVRDENYFYQEHYPPRARIPNRVIQFKQALDPTVGPSSVSERDVQRWRFEFTNATNVLGYAGRLDNDVPRLSIDAFLRSTPRSPVVYAGRIRRGSSTSLLKHERALHVGAVPYAAMGSFYTALAATTTQEGSDAQFLGNNKVLDSISVGTPVITHRNNVRVEYLGADYPGLFRTSAEAERIFRRFAMDEDFRMELHSKSVEAAGRLSMASASAFAHAQITEIVG